MADKKPSLELKSDQAYQARGIVTGVELIGYFETDDQPRFNINTGAFTQSKKPIFKYLTMDCGPDRPSICVKYQRQAETVRDETGVYLDMSKLKDGDILVAPGMIYRKIPWTTPLFNAHLAALKNYRRKDIVISEKADAPPIDLGSIDPLNLTKQ